MKEMSLQEKLNLISEMEAVGFHEQVIHNWIQDEEHPEETIRYKGNNAKEILEQMWKDIDEMPEVLTEDLNYECDSEGLPLIFTNRKRIND